MLFSGPRQVERQEPRAEGHEEPGAVAVGAQPAAARPRGPALAGGAGAAPGGGEPLLVALEALPGRAFLVGCRSASRKQHLVQSRKGRFGPPTSVLIEYGGLPKSLSLV